MNKVEITDVWGCAEILPKNVPLIEDLAFGTVVLT